MEEPGGNVHKETIRKRPLFLRILCVISFLGIVYAITIAVLDMMAASGLDNIPDQMNPALAAILNTGTTYLKSSQSFSLITIVAALICLSGVILMWRLKKMGFLFYVVGELSPVFALYFIFKSFYSNPFLSFAFLTTFLLKSLVAVTFIIMYSMNLKRMN